MAKPTTLTQDRIDHWRQRCVSKFLLCKKEARDELHLVFDLALRATEPAPASGGTMRVGMRVEASSGPKTLYGATITKVIGGRR